MTVNYVRLKAEQNERNLWGHECKLCGFWICECPVYRLADGGWHERMRRAAPKLLAWMDVTTHLEGVDVDDLMEAELY